MRRAILGLAAVMALALPSAYAGEVSIVQFRAQREQPLIVGYVAGLAAGMTWTNAALTASGKPGLFCFTATVNLDKETVYAIIDGEGVREKAEGTVKPDDAVGLVLLLGLQHTFPCPKP